MLYRMISDLSNQLYYIPKKSEGGERQALSYRSYTGSTAKQLLCCMPGKDLILPLPIGGIIHGVIIAPDELLFLAFTRPIGNLFNIEAKSISKDKKKAMGYQMNPRTGKLSETRVDVHNVGYCEAHYAYAHPYNLSPLFDNAKPITSESYNRVGLNGGLSYDGGFNEATDITGQTIFE